MLNMLRNSGSGKTEVRIVLLSPSFSILYFPHFHIWNTLAGVWSVGEVVNGVPVWRTTGLVDHVAKSRMIPGSGTCLTLELGGALAASDCSEEHPAVCEFKRL